MIERYTSPEMRKLWSEESKYERWLEVEIAHCRALEAIGAIPSRDLKEIEAKAAIDVARITAIENETHHDVIAFIESLSERVGASARFIHLGLTSTDLVDTAQALTLRRAFEIVLAKCEKLAGELKTRAIKHKKLICAGRTHGMHAEPTSFGLKFAIRWDELRRGVERIAAAKDRLAVGKLSGAVGTYSETTPELEMKALAILGLRPAGSATQVIQRDLHAEALAALAILAGTVEGLAVEIRHLQRSEVGEACEPFGKGQKGSSAMPHKKNPIACERISGLARIVRHNAGVAFENQVLWHERDISHSSSERIILADSFTLVDFILSQMTKIVAGLEVDEVRIASNLESSHGLIYSSRILSELLRRGVERKAAYDWVQKSALKTLKDGGAFLECLLATKFEGGAPPITGREIKELFSHEYLGASVDRIYARIGIER